MKGLIAWVLSVILSVAGIQDLGILSSGQVDVTYGNHICYSSDWKVT